MSKLIRFKQLLVSLFVIFFAQDGLAVDFAVYPEIGDKEMGQLRWALKIADQPISDFTNMEAEDQAGLTAYRYNIAFSAYFLALIQYHKLSACPEIIQPGMDRLIQKMISRPVWAYWAEVSQGIPMAEPKMNKPYPEQHDPVADQNIMYSGHLGHMIGLYETLYRDMKWDAPGSIVFKWKEGESYIYDNHLLQKVMHDQMKINPWHSIACEPNMVFPECNQHPVLSFMLYDAVHGTDLAQVKDQFFDFFLKRKMIDPNTHQACMYYLIKQDIMVSQQTPRFGNAYDLVLVPLVYLRAISLEGPSANGWTGAFMHAWQPDYIERHYPYQRDRHLVALSKNSAKFKWNVPDYWSPGLQYGFFAMLAAEVGDMATADQLIAFADTQYQPVEEAGTLHYPVNKKMKCNSLTGKLIAVARANMSNGIKAMHDKPFNDKHFSEPVVTGVDFPRLLLCRAIYDAKKKSLIITTEPGLEKQGQTEITVERLDSAKSYLLTIDGQPTESFNEQTSIAIRVPLDGRHDIILSENSHH